MKIDTREEFIIGEGISHQKIIKILAEAVIGFIVSSVRVFGFYPFGQAFAASATPAGLFGAIFGSLFHADDPLRYVAGIAAVYLIRNFVMKRFSLPLGAEIFISVLWGSILAEIFGLFLGKYSFAENLSFAVCGIVSGLIGYIFQRLKKGPEYSDTLVGQRMFFVFFNLSFAVFLFGIASLGGAFENAAVILSLTAVFCISERCGFFYTTTTAAILGISFWFYNPEYLLFLVTMIIGGLLSSFLKEIHRYAIVGAFVIASALIVIYSEGDADSFSLLVNTGLSGILFMMMPTGMIGKIMKFITPSDRGQTYKFRKRDPRKTYRFQRDELRDENLVKSVCAGCSKRLTCWVKDYAYTADMFLKIKNSAGRNIPSHFQVRCPYTADLIREVRKEKPSKGSMNIITSKISIPKKGEKVCGDCGGAFCASQYRYVLCIADGMGSGVAAAKQSTKGATVIKKLMDNGIEKADALRIVNEMLLNSKKEIIMGIDLIVIDLLSGLCESFKAGAAPTFLIRDGVPYETGGASLPIGMMEETDLIYNKYNIRCGDRIVMVSDGFVERGTGWIKDYLTEACSETDVPSLDISSGLTERAKRLGLNKKDDLTVITAEFV